MTIDVDKVHIKVKPVDQAQLKAILVLEFGAYVIRGFRIMKSRFENRRGDKLWLLPPSYEDSSGRYHPIFFVTDKDLWLRLEGRVWDEYYRQMEAYRKKQFGLRDEDLGQSEQYKITDEEETLR